MHGSRRWRKEAALLRSTVARYAHSRGKDDRSVPTAHTDCIVVITVELIAIPEHWLLWSERWAGRRAWPR